MRRCCASSGRRGERALPSTTLTATRNSGLLLTYLRIRATFERRFAHERTPCHTRDLHSPRSAGRRPGPPLPIRGVVRRSAQSNSLLTRGTHAVTPHIAGTCELVKRVMWDGKEIVPPAIGVG